MKIIFLDRAATDLDEIFDYVLQADPEAAQKLLTTIRERIKLLANFPALGRVGRVENTRELLISGTPYIAAYRVVSRVDAIVVLAVLHTARRWPDDFESQS